MITQLKQIGKSTRFKVFVDDRFVCQLESETIIKNHLKVGKDVDEIDLQQMQIESEKITAFEKSVDYISKSVKCERQVDEFLQKKGYLASTKKFVLEKLANYGYLSDRLYVESYVKDGSLKKSKKMLEFELSLKKIDKELICEILDEYDELPAVRNCVSKLLRGKTFDFGLKQKITSNLLSKGFLYDNISQVFNEVEE